MSPASYKERITTPLDIFSQRLSINVTCSQGCLRISSADNLSSGFVLSNFLERDVLSNK